MRINWKGIVIWLVIYMNCRADHSKLKKKNVRSWGTANLRAYACGSVDAPYKLGTVAVSASFTCD